MNTNTIPWQLVREGTFTKSLAKDEKRNIQVDLMRLDPNKTFKEHFHDDFEWVYILKGGFTDHRGIFKAGDFILNEKDSSHSTKTGPDGCELLCFWCGKVSY